MKKLTNLQTKTRQRRSGKGKVSFGEVLIMSVETLWGNKLRTGLTMLGVIIGISSVITIAALENIGLGDRLTNRPSQLSGGQQQRVAIARALVNHPALVLADEPTGALDSKTSHEIMNLLTELNQQGTTIAIVTHDATVADQTKRVIQMQDGVIVERAIAQNL
jgi:predicted ABC-type transport system involved in lysophospholipase L1 biosynthesis ATPase subunit